MAKKETYPQIDPLSKAKLGPGAENIKVTPGKCPRCRQRNTFVDDDNITVDTMLAGERVVISHLSGIRCGNCNELALDPDSTKIVEEVLFKSNRPLVRFRRKITFIAKRPAIYLPKDLLESIDIGKSREVLIYPRTRKSVVIEFA